MRRAGISQAELARACGVKAPSVHSWLSGKSKFLRGHNLLAAAKALNVSQNWLATGKGAIVPGVVESQADDLEFLSLDDCLSKLAHALSQLDDKQRSDAGHLLDLYARKLSPAVRQILLDTLENKA
jgi:transcriptional regulator with XRE-family HTH domain